MDLISISYALIYQFREHPEYKVTKCGKIFNTKTGRRIKKTVNSRCVGFWIKGKFISLSSKDKHLEKVKRAECPF